jgi:hypothetical protein
MPASNLVIEMQIKTQNLQIYKENEAEIDRNIPSSIAHF